MCAAMLFACILTALLSPVSGFDAREPSELEYFGVASKPGVAKRVANLTKEEFARLARSGVPFVITDGARGWPMKEWNCEYMQKEFGDVRFRREYGEGEMNTEIFKQDWTRQKVKIKGRKLPKGAPQYAPFYSDIVKARREEPERKWGKKSAAVAMEDAVVKSTRTPYCMEESNLKEMRRNPEFWLQPPETGSMAHMDEHCIPTIATTLSGVKRWRLAPIPAKPHAQGYFDGLVYERDEWDPLFEFETRAGESVIFPPGMIHEGLSVGTDCVSSITYQFVDPVPVTYWRTFYQRVRRTLDMRNCISFVSELATLGDLGYVPQPYKEAREHALGVGRSLDTNFDSSISLEELRKKWKRKPRGQYSSDFPVDAWHFHDTNEDGVLGVEEFATSFATWSATELQARQDGVKLEDPDERHEL